MVDHTAGADGKVQQRSFKHTILLGGVFGDSPGIKKVAKWLSHSAYLGCGYCMLRGTTGDKGGMYFVGYLAPTSYGAFAPGERQHAGAHSQHAAGTALCGAPETKLSHKKQRNRAKMVDKKKVDATNVGSHGLSCIVEELPYCHYNDVFVVPIAHAGLCGVVKDFWYQLLKTTARGQQAPWYALSSEARRVIASRESHLTPTCDFGRRYTDIVSKKGNWTMEDWLHWTEAWSVYVLSPHNGTPLLHPVVQQMLAVS